ncbi:uncharacterized protein Tco025E_09569 [Trypanosoma conorhini]|uniref:Uncharacterized protein n=1 Tax=Trypanosoma conorhini TaxID=83891 RepID=A0A3R7R6X0_9TRYP|nr:uncharacterized protein Tco025E_09569 [Trypanosoma conorhini]RNE97018.1 hypothetical protein Tco025E_09569 [Trypanosoma conorhini]
MRFPEPQQARGPSRRRASRRTTPQRPACTASAAGDGNDAPPRGGAPGHERPLCRALVIGDRGSFSQPIRWGRACTTTAPGARDSDLVWDCTGEKELAAWRGRARRRQTRRRETRTVRGSCALPFGDVEPHGS